MLCFLDQRVMAQMHAVEIADRHHGALKCAGHMLVVAEDTHQPFLGRLWTRRRHDHRLAFDNRRVADLADSVEDHAALLGIDSRTVHVVTTVSPMRTGALNRVVSDMKIVPGPGICMPSTVEI